VATTHQYYFSVIIPTFNRAHSVSKAINSVLGQTFSDFEIIIVDDASTDNTEAIVASFHDDRISYIKNDTNKERCISRNKGIEKATGKYICFLDSDDYHLPEHLQKLYQFIHSKKEPEALFFTNSWNEDEQGHRTERNCPDFEKYNSYSYFLHYTVNPQRWAVHHQVFAKIKFDSKIVICEDMDTSLRILAAGYPVYQLKERTTVYVAAEDSFTVSDKNKAEKELLNLNRIFKREELKGKLSFKEKNRLFSMCHFHLAIKANEAKQKAKMYNHAVKSFVLCPKGYNGKTNKILLVMCLYGLPVFGNTIESFIRITKNRIN
jgi:glycosyltransferase involved in cell wall biosynthesis